MASRALQMATRARPLQIASRNPNPAFILRFFSSSSASDDADNNIPPPSSSPSSSASSSLFSSSDFKDVKDKLKQPPQSPRKPSSFSFSTPSSFTPPSSSSNVRSVAEIRKNLAAFRSRVSDSIPSPSQQSSSSPRISFQDLYNRNVVSKPEDSSGVKSSFASIRESLKHIQPSLNSNEGRKDSMSLLDFKNSLKLQPVDESSVVMGGSNSDLPMAVFGKNLSERKKAESTQHKMVFSKTYSMSELGEKLRNLRPKTRGENWFSLKELNERLMKLIEMDEKEDKDPKVGSFSVREMRKMLSGLVEEKKSSVQSINILSNLGGTPSFRLASPKEHLVEQYFHPDNMSSAEKMKIELKKVRDEFKMSESDCGSARVQVAQLTTKIKHLSSVLHKKDKHSRKGLHEMVQRRKKLLKYLRRTDWDSYCLVLSNLGLRDNPNYKA